MFCFYYQEFDYSELKRQAEEHLTELMDLLRADNNGNQGL